MSCCKNRGLEDIAGMQNVECFMYSFNDCSIVGLTRRRRIVKMNLFVLRGSVLVGNSERLRRRNN